MYNQHFDEVKRSGNGGGIYITDKNSSVTFNAGSIEGNIAAYGAGIYLASSNDRLYINGGLITHNNAKKDGGGVYINHGRAEMTAGEISYNRAQGDAFWYNGGGGVYLNDDGDTFRMSGGKIVYNSAVRNGGGILAYDGHITAVGTEDNHIEISDNVAQNSGGALFDREGDHTFTYVDFHGNSADTDGAAMTLGYSGTSINHCSFRDNIVRKSSGAVIYNNGMTFASTSVKVKVSDSEIMYNRIIEDRSDYSPVIWIYDKSNADCSNTKIAHNTLGSYATWDSVPEESRRGKSEKPRNYIAGTYQFIDNESPQDISTEFVYQDNYFYHSGAKYDSHLATMSLNLAMAAFASYTDRFGTEDVEEVKKLEAEGYYAPGDGRDHNIADLYEKIGFTDYASNYPHAEKDTIGFAIATKETFGATIVAIALRGSNYEREWASNLKIGDGTKYNGEHEGFAESAEFVMSYLADYLEQHDLTSEAKKGGISFWVVGHSRAGAVANLVGKRLIETYNPEHDCSNVFAYSFEPPKGGSENAKHAGYNYDGLHCIINQSDIVPYLAPAEMGFIHYGTVVNIPRDRTETVGYVARRRDMLKQLENINPTIRKNFNDEFRGGTLNLAGSVVLGYIQKLGFDRFDSWASRFMYDFVYWNDFDELENYYGPKTVLFTESDGKSVSREELESLQEALQDLIDIAFSIDTVELKEDVKNLSYTDFINIGTILGLGSLYTESIFKENFRNSQTAYNTILSLTNTACVQDGVYQKLYEAAEENGYLLEDLLFALYSVMNLGLTYFSDDYINNYADDLGTMALNMSNIFQAHTSEVNLAWLRTYDTYYNEDGVATAEHLSAVNFSEELVTESSDVYKILHFEADDSWNAIKYEYEIVEQQVFGTTTKDAIVTNKTDEDQTYTIRVRAQLQNPNNEKQTYFTPYSEHKVVVPAAQVVTLENATYRSMTGWFKILNTREIRLAEGGTLTITADVKENQRFVGWKVTSKDANAPADWSLADETSSETILTVKENRALTVTALYEDQIKDIDVQFEPYAEGDTKQVTWKANDISYDGELTLLSEEIQENDRVSTWKITLNKDDAGENLFADTLSIHLHSNASEDPMYTGFDQNYTYKNAEDCIEVFVTTHYHIHTYASEYHESEDGTQHYRECTDAKCPVSSVGLNREYEGHMYGEPQVITDDSGTTTYLYQCGKCGHQESSSHRHMFSDWMEDAENQTHYQLCLDAGDDHDASVFYNVEKHIDADEDGFCDKCHAETVISHEVTIVKRDTNPLRFENPKQYGQDGNLTAQGYWQENEIYLLKGKYSDEYVLTAPREEGEKFTSWYIPTNEQGEAAIELVDGYHLEDATIHFRYVMKNTEDGLKQVNDEAVIHANYKPVIQSVEIATERNADGQYAVPTAGEQLPDLSKLNVKISDTYSKEQLETAGVIKYSWLDQNGSEVSDPAGYGESYTLHVEAAGLDSDMFALSDNLKLTVNDIQVNSDAIRYEDGMVSLNYTFAQTEQLYVDSCVPVIIVGTNPDEPGVMQVAWDTPFDALNLPENTYILTQDSSQPEGILADIHWYDWSYDSRKIGKQTLEGYVIVPDGVQLRDDVELNVSCVVNVLPPELEKPVLNVEETSESGIVKVTIDHPENHTVGDLYYSYTVTAADADGQQTSTDVERTYLSTPGTPFEIDLAETAQNAVNVKLTVNAWMEAAGITGEINSESSEYVLNWKNVTYYSLTPDGEETSQTTPYLVGRGLRLKPDDRAGEVFTTWLIKDDNGNDVTDALLNDDESSQIITSFKMPDYNIHIYPQYESDQEQYGEVSVKFVLTTEVEEMPENLKLNMRIVDEDGFAYTLNGEAAEENEWIAVPLDHDYRAELKFSNLPDGIYTVVQDGLTSDDACQWNITVHPDKLVIQNGETEEPGVFTVTDTYVLKDDSKYGFTDDGDIVTYEGDKDDLGFGINGDIDLFEGIKVDGILIDEKYYRISEDGKKIWLTREFLNTLKPGRHTIEAVYRYHSDIIRTFWILARDKKNPEKPGGNTKTADYTSLYAAFAGLIIAAGAAMFFIRKRRDAE